MLRFFLGSSKHPVVRIERCKLLASGCQLIAIGILGAAIIAPIFNPSVKPAPLIQALGAFMSALIELLAMRILGYLGERPRTGETGDD